MTLLLPAATVLPAATAVLRTRLPPACLPACLICRAPCGCRRAENTVQQDQPELSSRKRVRGYSDFWLLQGLGLWAEGGGVLCLACYSFFWSLKFRHGRAKPVKRTCPL